MATYNYNNGNYSSQTTIVNGVAYQQNITNIGGSCGGDNTCVDGYSLYFPCIKNITRGQNVCFEFYVGDNANQDELDIRDLDALSLTLSGAFGCEYGTYTYPDDIKSLQYEEYEEIIFEDFNGLPINICELSFESINESGENVNPNVTGKIGTFYIGSDISLIADDTPTHIFVCWGKKHIFDFDDNCNEVEDEIEYDIITTNREYSFTITEDTTVYAVYRERKKYEIRVSFENRHSHFEVYDESKRYYMSDKERDVVYALEGYEYKIVCIPNKNFISGDFYYIFEKWNDGYNLPARKVIIDDMNPLLNNGKILLLAKCSDATSSNIINEINSVTVPTNDFIYKEPDMNDLFDGIEYKKFTSNDNIIEANNVKIAYESKNGNVNGLLYIKDGYIKTNLLDIEDGVKIKVRIIPDSVAVINFEMNGENIPYNIDGENSDIDVYEFDCLFRNCNNSFIKIDVEGSLYIDEITIYEEIIYNKGKMQLCLNSEDTEKMYTGVLNASGAISVDGNIFGISQTQIGNINNLKTINIL